jgi:hypothetical protein
MIFSPYGDEVTQLTGQEIALSVRVEGRINLPSTPDPDPSLRETTGNVTLLYEVSNTPKSNGIQLCGERR